MNSTGKFNKYVFEYYLAYAHKRGIPREKAKELSDVLRQCCIKFSLNDRVEPVFDMAIEILAATEWSPPSPPPLTKAQRMQPPSLPLGFTGNEPRIEPPLPVNERRIDGEPLDLCIERFYDPPSELAVDVHLASDFEKRMLAVDWNYYMGEA